MTSASGRSKLSSAHNGDNSALWEWEDDSGRFIPYSASICHHLERAYGKGLVSTYLGDSEPVLAAYTVQFHSFVQQNQHNGRTRRVRRQLYPSDSVATLAFSGVRWQWRGDHRKEWNSFDTAVQNYLENEYGKGLLEVDLAQDFKLNYSISFETMTQRNKSSGFVRSVRRKESLLNSASSKTNSCSGASLVSPSSKTNSCSGASLVSASVNKSTGAKPKSQIDGRTSDPNVAHSYNTRSSKKQCTPDGAYSTSTGATISKKHPVSSNQSKPKRTKSFNRCSSLVKTLTAPARALASLFAPAIYSPVVVGSYNNHQNVAFSERRDIPGVKAPSSICMKRPQNVPSVSEVVSQYSRPVDNIPAEEVCCICCDELASSSTYSESETVVGLTLCRHMFHQACLEAMYMNGVKDGSIQCPTCKTFHGIKYGNQPEGAMDYYVHQSPLPGFPNCGTICVNYSVRPGIQGPEHPHPGQPFTARGFPRYGYLPNNEEGQKVLRLLVTAWERALIFTVGTSSTTGEENTVTWNEIHHKTEWGSDYSGHGYPDPHYIDNVLHELAIQGVVDSEQ